MSDAGVSVDGGSAAASAPAPASTDASLGAPSAPAEMSSSTTPEVPAVPQSPASDPQPAETPAVPEQPAEPAQPAETPVIQTPQEVPPAQATHAPAPALTIKDRAYAALEKIRWNKRTKLDRIVALAQKKRSIKNDDVEKLLKVSDSTAQRYLSQLVVEGKLRRSGATAGIMYEAV